MPRRKRTALEPEDFAMTPMIDMVFLLLVFFMTVSTLAQADKKLDLDLAESNSSQVPKQLEDRGALSIDQTGKIYLGQRLVSLKEMQRTIKGELQANPELKIQIRADAQTPYRSIEPVLNACSEVGAYSIIYSTYQVRKS